MGFKRFAAKMPHEVKDLKTALKWINFVFFLCVPKLLKPFAEAETC